MDILYKVMFSTLPSIFSGVWYSILIDKGINVLQNLVFSFDHTIHGSELLASQPNFCFFRKLTFTDIEIM